MSRRARSSPSGSVTMVKLPMRVTPGAVIAATVEPDGGVDSPTQKPFVTAQA